MKNALTLMLALTFSHNLVAGEFVCNGSVCSYLSIEDKKVIEEFVENEIREKGDYSEKTINIVAPMPEKLIVGTTRMTSKFVREGEKVKTRVIHSEEIAVFGHKLPKKPHTIETINSDEYKSFRYYLNNSHDVYFLSEAYMERERLTTKNPYLQMATVGVGTKVTKDWVVEVGMIKEVRDRNNQLIKDINAKPSGMMLTFRRRW